MSATPDVDADFQALVQGLGEDLRCQFTSDCPIHGVEDCEYRARWMAVLRCRDEDCGPRYVLACDPCHDGILDGGNETADAIVLEWLPL